MRLTVRKVVLSIGVVCSVLVAGECVCLGTACAADAASDANSAASKFAVGFAVGFGKRDITPPAGLAMWGYGDRGDSPAVGALDPLFATAIVIHAGTEKLAIVGLDLGRGPTRSMMDTIRRVVADVAKINYVLVCGSHTHHGPMIEITDREGLPAKYFPSVDYSTKLPELIVDAILEADKHARPARMGVVSTSVQLNVNRQAKRLPKPTEPMLAVMRFDDEAGRPIAVLVNYAAHPTITNNKLMKYSADYPGFMKRKVEAELHTNCVFIQGAAGDMSVSDKSRGAQGFGEMLADAVIPLARGARTEVPKHPSVEGKVDAFLFHLRPRPAQSKTARPETSQNKREAGYAALRQRFTMQFKDGVPAELNTILLNGDVAIVGASGEFFCNHSNRLKERAYVPRTLFFGYCNGHSMYFPTIEAASEGGYGADSLVARAEIGAGEKMMDQALMNLYLLLGKFKAADVGRK
jgi:neutral/alkaline ceramidase-like enzyme